jgi:hypothetical protein
MISSPAVSVRPIARAMWNVSVVMLAPNAISSVAPPTKSAIAARDAVSIASVSALDG